MKQGNMNGEVQWFGLKPFGAVCEEDNHAVTPVGKHCNWCNEAIEADDSGMLMLHMGRVVPESKDDFTVVARYQPYHHECMLRQVIGSCAHIEGRCSCVTGAEEPESGLSKREEAKKAFLLWSHKMGQV